MRIYIFIIYITKKLFRAYLCVCFKFQKGNGTIDFEEFLDGQENKKKDTDSEEEKIV